MSAIWLRQEMKLILVKIGKICIYQHVTEVRVTSLSVVDFFEFIKTFFQGAEKSTYWTSRSIESSFIHSSLLMLAILSMIFTYLELIYNIFRLMKVS